MKPMFFITFEVSLPDDLPDLKTNNRYARMVMHSRLKELDEQKRFASHSGAASTPSECPATYRRNRSARFACCHTVTQRHDREKTGTESDRSFPRDLYR